MLEMAVDKNVIVQKSADTTLKRIALYCRYGSVKSMLRYVAIFSIVAKKAIS